MLTMARKELTQKSTEDDLREFLKDHYAGKIIMTRLETSISPGFSQNPYQNRGGVYSLGVYDTHVRSHNADCFVELKKPRIPVRATTQVNLGVRPSQIRWGREYRKMGGHDYVIAYGHPLVYILYGNNIKTKYSNKAEFYAACHLIIDPDSLPLDLFDSMYLLTQAPFTE